LLKKLRDNQTPACGTVRRNRAAFPKLFVTQKMKTGETLHIVKDEILGMRYKDKRDVFFLSTIHRLKLVSVKKKDREGNNTL